MNNSLSQPPNLDLYSDYRSPSSGHSQVHALRFDSHLAASAPLPARHCPWIAWHLSRQLFRTPGSAVTEGAGAATAAAGGRISVQGEAVLVGVPVQVDVPVLVLVDVLVLVSELSRVAILQEQDGLQVAKSEAHRDRLAPGSSRHCLSLFIHRAKQWFSPSWKSKSVPIGRAWFLSSVKSRPGPIGRALMP